MRFYNVFADVQLAASWLVLRAVALVPALLVVTLLLVLGVVLLPNFTRTHCCGPLTSCKSNLKNIASACELYAVDHGGYPDSLARLHPRYLETVPHCPSFDDGRSLLWPWQGQSCQAGRRWLLGRTLAVDGCWNWGRSNYILRSTPETFTITCAGLNHRESGISAPNYPQYFSTTGMVER